MNDPSCYIIWSGYLTYNYVQLAASRQGIASHLLHEVEEIEVLGLHHCTAEQAPKENGHN